MKRTEKTYSLSAEYWMAECTATSFKKAREIFNAEFSGKYTILCRQTGETKNVILK